MEGRVRQLNWIKAKMILPNDCMDVDRSDVPPQGNAEAAQRPEGREGRGNTPGTRSRPMLKSFQ